MPTPFHHLSLAEDLLHYGDLAGQIRQFLHAYPCEFFFGNTAPDVQVVSGQARQQTHFFSLPVQPRDLPPWEVFLAGQPGLVNASKLPLPQAAFIAGYLCHLQADWLWVKEVFAPYFGPESTWGTFHKRLYLHNVLRAYLDVRILVRLGSEMHACLDKVVPEEWLSFVRDAHLLQWRDFLTLQLKPGASIQTVEVLSSRQGVPTPEFYDLLGSDGRMQQEVFSHLPLGKVESYQQLVLEENTRLLSEYLASFINDFALSTAIQGVQL